VNSDVYTSKEVLIDKAVIINGNMIEDLVEIDRVPKEIETIDAEGKILAPGFIDIQVNGGGGVLFNDAPTVESINTIFSAHLKYGVTSILPTLISDDVEKMKQAIDSVEQMMKIAGNHTLGIHLEGPYIEVSKAGVHEKKHIRKISLGELKTILDSTSAVKLITLAPELLDSSSMKYLLEKNIVMFAGHTNASFNTCNEFFKNGGKGATHLFNAMSQLTGREPGVVGATFFNKNAKGGIIVDGHHVDLHNVAIASRLMKGRLFLVTDSMPSVGSEIESFNIGEVTIFCKDGKCVTADGTIGGSNLNMLLAVRNCVSKCGIPLDEALRMSSTYQAELLGYGHILGKISPGYHANLILIDNTVHIHATIVNGEYEKR